MWQYESHLLPELQPLNDNFNASEEYIFILLNKILEFVFQPA